MSKLKQQPDSGNATLDDLVALVEEAARTIVGLKAENAVLVKEVREYQAATQSEASELEIRRQRIEELEQSVAALKEENAALIKEVQEAKMAALAKASELDIRKQRIKVLDQSIAAMRKDADLCRWMRSKFSNSSFLNHIEKLYSSDHPGEKKISGPTSGI